MRMRQLTHSNRHGATLVLVAVMIIVLGGMAAFAIDLARIYSGANELQTGADASALAAARRAQLRPGRSAVSGTVAFAANNSAFGSPITLAGSDVQGGFWDPVDETFTPVSWRAANAVRVTARRATNVGFGGIMAATAVSPNRSSVAWIGNQASLDCIKPWGIDLGYITALLGASITSQAGVNTLHGVVSTAVGQQTMTMVLRPNIDNPRGAPNAADTSYTALTSPITRNKEYDRALFGLNCEGTADYDVGSSEYQIETQGGRGGEDIPAETIEWLESVPGGSQRDLGARQTCAAQIGDDASCINPATGEVGVTVNVAVVTRTAPDLVTVNATLSFRLMCVFRGDGSHAGTSTDEYCPWLAAAGRTSTNFTQGTLVGFPVSQGALTGPGNTLGNTIGPNQKLVLVK